MVALKQRLRKYFIMGSPNCKRDPVRILEEAVQAGVTAFQYREKGEGALTGNDKLALGKRLRDVCRRHDVLFIVNDDVELVEPLEADGVHVGQEDQSVDVLRESFPDKIIGLSVANEKEVEQSPISRVDYVGAGPVFPTATKPDAKSPVGVAWIKTLRERFPHLPIVGVGGIDTHNAASVIKAGADGVSVISAITQAEDIQATVHRL